VTLPTTKITPIYPGEFSGTTYGFTALLSKVSPAWKKSVGVVGAVQYRVGTSAAGDSGVGAAVNATEGAIGYVSAPYASAAGLRVAKIENAAGESVAPSAESLIAAGKALTKVSPSGIVDAAYPPATATGAYPPAIFGYAVVPHAAPQKGFDQQFLNYVVGPGQKLGEAFDLVPMPKAVKTTAREMIAAL
jgi:phosphate transport system substrate-binding protein